jgi:drug/metabolite transporter (DMT)-like permease
MKVIVALIVSFVGIVILLAPTDFFVKKSLIGSVAGLFVGVFGGLVYVLSKTFKSYDKVSLTFWQNLIAVPFLIPLLFFQRPEISAFNIFWVIVIALCGALGFIFTFSGLKPTKASYSSILTLLNPVFTIVLAFFFFKEVPNLSELIGGILIFLGVYLVISKRN